MKMFPVSLSVSAFRRIVSVIAFSALVLVLINSQNAGAWSIMYTNNDGKLETTYIQCENGKQFPLSRWIYQGANKYQRLWVWDAGKSTSMGSNAVHLGRCNQSGHYDLGAKASYFCGCIGSR